MMNTPTPGRLGKSYALLLAGWCMGLFHALMVKRLLLTCLV